MEPIFVPKNVSDLRSWFAENHKTTPSIWIVIYKKSSNKRVVSPDDIIEEAICHGWIDSKTKSIDEESYGVYLTPRRTGSHWTEQNKHLAERMITEGRMTVHGMDVYATSK
jgi:uncharacterized protein YdeI (YjbR/CyaY-like superfamily)